MWCDVTESPDILRATDHLLQQCWTEPFILSFLSGGCKQWVKHAFILKIKVYSLRPLWLWCGRETNKYLKLYIFMPKHAPWVFWPLTFPHSGNCCVQSHLELQTISSFSRIDANNAEPWRSYFFLVLFPTEIVIYRILRQVFLSSRSSTRSARLPLPSLKSE